jgi:hypothetical protein
MKKNVAGVVMKIGHAISSQFSVAVPSFQLAEDGVQQVVILNVKSCVAYELLAEMKNGYATFSV